jgi:hypothetical protein
MSPKDHIFRTIVSRVRTRWSPRKAFLQHNSRDIDAAIRSDLRRFPCTEVKIRQACLCCLVVESQLHLSSVSLMQAYCRSLHALVRAECWNFSHETIACDCKRVSRIYSIVFTPYSSPPLIKSWRSSSSCSAWFKK